MHYLDRILCLYPSPPPCLQESAGVYNEVTFRALDWLLDQASRHGIRVILSFADNWKYPGEP